MDPDPYPDPYWPPSGSTGSGSGSVKNEYGSTTLVLHIINEDLFAHSCFCILLDSVMDSDLHGSAFILVGWTRARIRNENTDSDEHEALKSFKFLSFF